MTETPRTITVKVRPDMSELMRRQKRIDRGWLWVFGLFGLSIALQITAVIVGVITQ